MAAIGSISKIPYVSSSFEILKEQYQKAIKLHEQELYEEAYALFSQAVEMGHTNAKIALGFMIFNGKGCQKDLVQAEQLIMEAATKGIAEAQYGIGRIYLERPDCSAKFTAAVDWFKRAAEQDHPEACFCLGWMFEHGQGVPGEFETAHVWYGKAASLGEPDAMIQLGLMYQEARGIGSDLELARQYYERALETSQRGEAAYLLGSLYLQQAVEDPSLKGLALEYFRRAVFLGYKEAEAGLQGLLANQ